MYKTLGLVRISVLISAITKSFWVFFSVKLFYKSNRKLFSCVCIAWYKHSRRWENSRQLCKPSTSTGRTPSGSWTHRSGWTNSHQAKPKSWWSWNSASVLEGRRIIFSLQFLSRHWHPLMQLPTLHSVYLIIVSRRTETARFWMGAVYMKMLGAPWLCTILLFFTNCDTINLFSGFVGQKDLGKNNRNVKWPFRTEASKGKSTWMIVHFFHESLLHFIESFYGALSFLWEFAKSLYVKFIFSRHHWGPLYYYM